MLKIASQSQKVLALFYAQLCHNAFSSVARQRKYYRPDFTEMALETILTITQLTLLTQTLHSD